MGTLADYAPDTLHPFFVVLMGLLGGLLAYVMLPLGDAALKKGLSESGADRLSIFVASNLLKKSLQLSMKALPRFVLTGTDTTKPSTPAAASRA